MLKRYFVVAVQLAVLGGCMGATRSAVSTDLGVPQGVRELLLEELRRAVSPEDGRPTLEAIRITADSSQAVTGMVYFWGGYVPPGTADVDYLAVVAHRADHSRVVRTVDDWAAIASGWVAGSEEHALLACQELLHTTSERRVFPQIFRQGDSIRQFWVRDPEFLEAKLSPPTVNARGESTWTVRAWVVGPRDVTHYECIFGPGRAVVEKREVLKGYGIAPLI